MNLPNKITLLRIMLIPFVIFFYLASSFIPGAKLIATILFIVAVKSILRHHRAKECDDICMPFRDIIRLIPDNI